MAKIKSYTNLEQSKILAEILPIESADMHYATWTILGGEFIVSPNQGDTIESLQEDYGDQIIPCWSLAALLDVLPKFIGDYGKCLYYDVNGYYCGYMADGDFMLTIEETKANNPIDACYEMILKLHEQKLL